MAEKMNMVEKFNAVIAILEGEDSVFTRDEAIEFLMGRAEKAKSKPRAAKANPELDAFRAKLADWLKEQTEPVTASVAGAAMGVSVQKASHGLKFLVTSGVAESRAGEKARDALSYVAL